MLKNITLILFAFTLSIGTASAQVVMVDKTGTITPVNASVRKLSESEAMIYKNQATQKTQVSKLGMKASKTWTVSLNENGGGTTVTIPTTVPPPTFSGFIRREGDRVVVLFDEILAGTIIFGSNHVMGGGYSTDPIQFQETLPRYPGSLWGFEIPIVANVAYGQWVEAYQFRYGQMSTMSMTVDEYNQPRTVVAAYEKLILKPTGNGLIAENALVIIGDFDPNQPASIFAGNIRIYPEVLAVEDERPYKKTTLRLPADATQYLGGRYPLSICQWGSCPHAKMVDHIWIDNGGGGGIGKGISVGQ